VSGRDNPPLERTGDRIICNGLRSERRPLNGHYVMCRMRVVAPNKLELWASIALVVLGNFLFRGHLPLRPTDTIGFVVIVLFAWVTALNASLDLKRMSWPLRALAVVWFLYVSWVALRTVPPEFTFDRRWADR
jgi:hypothetical protein